MTREPLVAATYETPVGDLSVLTDQSGTVWAAGMGGVADVALQLPADAGGWAWEDGPQSLVAPAVGAWLEGDADAITAVPVHLEGSPFTVDVWTHMREIPGGAVASYAELAEMTGRPRASRAVGTACARNRVGIFVPCHRVVQAGGRLGSYGFGGTGIKAQLLQLEGVTVDGTGAAARLTETGRWRRA
ncbi:methylated-DNA--[protein]-cysteine S-methyltransferase [Demequina sp. B12]|uniref:methylated-DNA--[protein]-cysteine S-methyltransferase n=1 Tax=Demequina sp. B12 TaxID=2992757 RepID=UPI00237C2ECE|nr:methylated-DNA--[protein]-cysteine S-methyltransferase [Demequina sp. B12]MDE0571929.1 methylated-DNA--[protein]-cysteine S-methyltransferase [Demequina sp. B12]